MFNLFKKKNSKDVFNGWMNQIVSNENPDEEIIAYNIGLIETEKGYSAYFMGAKKYDENDSDWACDFGDYTPKIKYLDLSKTELKKLPWDEVQNKIIEFSTEFMKTKTYENSFLQKAKAITVGFDDGDLMRIK
ncbi:MAG: hypothetical protein PHD23_09815 [Eubacteriales bacterium]|nr:hypothetical protein [Eubacteriales bacterium]